MIKVTNGQIWGGSVDSLTKVLELNLPAKTSFKLVKLIRKVNEILQDIQEAHKKLLEKFGEKDKDGEFIHVLDQQTGKPNENQIQLKKDSVKPFKEEYKQLLEVENEIQGTKVTLDDLGDIEIQPGVLLTLDWLFDDGTDEEITPDNKKEKEVTPA